MKNDFGKKFSNFAIPNLSLYLIIGYATGYIISMLSSQFLDLLTLDPAMILRGQIWRLVTWVLIPPNTSNLFLVVLMLYANYCFGSALERAWGSHRYTCYLLSGILFTIIGVFLLYGIFAFMGVSISGYGMLVSTYYVNMSIFLAFAATFPETQVLFMYVLPVKVKHMGIIYGVYLLLECVMGGMISWVVIGSSLLNFVVFFIRSRGKMGMSVKQAKRSHEYKSKVRHTVRITRHKCAICGRTEESNPELEFRFCSKCNGNYEYCQDHLFTHKHVQ